MDEEQSLWVNAGVQSYWIMENRLNAPSREPEPPSDLEDFYALQRLSFALSRRRARRRRRKEP